MRARPDDAHAALQHVEELGQLVERGAAQEAAERVTRSSPRPPACTAPSSDTVIVRNLKTRISSAVEAVAALAEEYRPR